MKKINYIILLIIFIIFTSCKTEDNSSDAGIDAEDTADVSGQDDISNDVINCIDNDGDQYGEGDDCLGLDCDDNVSVCNTDCSDHDNDGVEDCNFCPDSPHKIGSYEQDDEVLYSITLKENYAFISADTGLLILDISDAKSPQKVVFFESSDDYSNEPRILTMKDNYVFLGYSSYGRNGGGLQILDVSNVNSPQEVCFDKTIGDIYAINVSGDYAYVGDVNGLRIIDISNIDSPQEVSFYDTPRNPSDIIVKDNYAFVADNGSGLRIIDISNVNSPHIVGYYDTPGDAYALELKDNYAFVADYNTGMRIINITNVNSPQEVSFVTAWGSSLDNNVWSVAISGNHALFVDREDGLFIIDISDINSPQYAGHYNDNNARDVAIRNGYAFVVFEYGVRLQVISLLCED